jgi:Predicted membrane protein (DUF2079)
VSTAVTDRPLLAADPDEPPRRDTRFELAIRVAWVVLAIQLVAMILWSSLLYSRWGITYDYAIRYQGWWGIAHGNLDPYVTVASRFFWQDHFELINWPLAPISLLWPGGLWPLWIQDVMVFGGEAGALLLVTDAVRRPGWPRRLPGWLAVGLVTLLLVANPWVYESISFDFHYQSVGAACFAMLACREMIKGRTRWLVLWVVLCLSCGDIAGSYLAAVGIGGVLAGRDSRRRGWALAVGGVAWFLLVSVIGGGKGSSLSGHYGYLAVGTAAAAGGIGIASILKGLLTHPGALVSHLWAARLDLWAYVVGSGGLGLFTPLSVLPLLVLFESGAGNGAQLRSIVYENFGAVLFMVPLSVLALAWLTRQLDGGWASDRLIRGARWLRSKWVPRIIAVVLVVNALVWGAVWIPQVSNQWLRTDSAAASTLNQVERMIPASAEVVASQGIIGRLSGRRWLYQIAAAAVETYPLETADTYFVVVPYQGIETASVQAQLGIIAELAGPFHAQLLLDRNGVWLFRFHRTPAIHSLHFEPSPTEPAWALRTATGGPLLDGPAADWAMTQRRSTSGYLLYGADWNLLPGSYQTTITLSSSVPIVVETWDSTTNVLFSRDHVPATEGHVAVQSVVHVDQIGGDLPYSGWGPFSFLPERSASAADRIEIRVFTQGGGDVRIYNLEMQRIHVPRTPGG